MSQQQPMQEPKKIHDKTVVCLLWRPVTQAVVGCVDSVFSGYT